MQRKLLVLIACLMCVPALGAGNWAPTKKLDVYFDALGKSQRVSAAIAISEKGVLRYERVIGFATIENGVPQPADAGTRYQIGPVSALFTTVLVMQLAEKASITLDTPLAEFYPDLPNALVITYRDLLAQRSGLADYTRSPGFQDWRSAPRSRDELLRAITAGGAGFAPRARVEYNPTNYLLLGYVLEKVYERPYDELVRRQIAEKLGLARTYQAGAGRSSSLEATGCLRGEHGWMAQPQSDPSVAGGASGIYSNATDLVRFIDGLFAGKLVSAHSLDSMRGQESDTPLGLWPREFSGQSGYGNSGNADGFAAAVYHFPARGLSIAVTSNALDLPMDDILTEVLSTIFLRGYRPPSQIKPAG
jgi:CubicO group peptidase (beta-lactamase class C family)